MQIKIFRPLSLLLTLCLVSGPTVAAKIYKWVDEDGNVQYSQTPPGGDTEVEEIKPPPKPADAEAAARQLEERRTMLEETREARLEAGADARANQEQREVKQQRCEQARKHLASYQRPRVNVVGDDGQRRRATEAERQSQLVKAREMVDRECNQDH